MKLQPHSSEMLTDVSADSIQTCTSDPSHHCASYYYKLMLKFKMSHLKCLNIYYKEKKRVILVTYLLCTNEHRYTEIGKVVLFQPVILLTRKVFKKRLKIDSYYR